MVHGWPITLTPHVLGGGFLQLLLGRGRKPRSHVTGSWRTFMMGAHLSSCTDSPCSTKFGFLARTCWTGLGTSPLRALTKRPLRYQWDLQTELPTCLILWCLRPPQKQLALGFPHSSLGWIWWPQRRRDLATVLVGKGGLGLASFSAYAWISMAAWVGAALPQHTEENCLSYDCCDETPRSRRLAKGIV